MLLKTIPLKARIENQPNGIAGILYHGTEIYESWTTLLLNPTLLKDESPWSSRWCLIRTHHNHPVRRNLYPQATWGIVLDPALSSLWDWPTHVGTTIESWANVKDVCFSSHNLFRTTKVADFRNTGTRIDQDVVRLDIAGGIAKITFT